MNAWLILVLSILCNTAGNLLVKRFASGTPIQSPWDYASPWFLLGIAAFGIGLVLYGRALRDLPIVVAYPVQVGACVLIIAAAAVTLFGERIGAAEILGIALILAGIALLGRVAA